MCNKDYVLFYTDHYIKYCFFFFFVFVFVFISIASRDIKDKKVCHYAMVSLGVNPYLPTPDLVFFILK